MRLERLRFQLRMILHADEPRMVRQLDRSPAARRRATCRRTAGPSASRHAPVVDVHLVAVAMALLDPRRAAIDLADTSDPGPAPPDRRRAASCRPGRRPRCAARPRCRAPIRSAARPPARRTGRTRSTTRRRMPARLRAASITAICMPKQMPKNGTLFSRAKRTASILPWRAALAEAAGHQDAVHSSSRCTAPAVLEYLAVHPVEIAPSPGWRCRHGSAPRPATYSCRAGWCTCRRRRCAPRPPARGPHRTISCQRDRSGSPSAGRSKCRSTSRSMPSA